MTGTNVIHPLKRQNTSAVLPKVTCDVCGQKTRLEDLLSHQIRKRCLESKLKHDVVCAVKKETDLHNRKCAVCNSIKSMAKEVRLHQRELELQHRQLTRQFRRSETSLREKTFIESAYLADDISRCQNCAKPFKASQNGRLSCRWHRGPIVDLFGGTCSACGKLDYQAGCMTGQHESCRNYSAAMT